VGLSLEQKKTAVQDVSDALRDAQAIILAEYRSLPVSEITQLRAKARASKVYFHVVKNTLARRAVADTPFSPLAEHMVGPLVYGISTDPAAAAKVLHEFAKGNDKLVIKGGALAGKVLGPNEVASLASLPSREELIAKLLATMQAPIATFVRTLNEVPSKFARALSALRDQKERNQ
jgi:large subunit ribosomal protein L10